MEYKGYTIILNANKKFEITNDDLTGVVRDTYQQLIEYIDRVVAGRGKVKREKIALKVLAQKDRWGHKDKLIESTITGIHMGHGRLLGVNAYEVYPAVEKVRTLLAEIMALDEQTNKKKEALAKYAMQVDRKQFYRNLEPGNYDRYIKELIAEYEKKAAL